MEETVRVLHVIKEMVLEGAESRIMDLYRNIDTEKVQFDFAVQVKEQAYFDEEIRKRGGRIYVWPKFRFGSMLKYIKEVNIFFQKHREYQIIHGHIISYGFIYQLIAKKNGVKLRIAHARTSSVERTIKGLITLLLLKPLKYCVTNCFACSGLAGEFAFGRRFMRKGKVRIIKDAIEVRDFLFSPQSRELKRIELEVQDKFVIGHVGTFRYAKNHKFLLEVFTEIAKERSEAVLLLVGDGGLKKQIEQQAHSLGIKEKVIFAGHRNDVAELLSAMDIFLFPSHYEGLPGAVTEAQAAGLQCFVSDTVTEEVRITELLEFISLKQPAAYWADRIIKKADYQRKNMYSKIAAKGFDVKAVAEELQEFYLKSLKRT